MTQGNQPLIRRRMESTLRQAWLLRRLPIISALALTCINLPSASPAAGSDVKILMSNEVVSDSVSQNNPKALPGAVIEYQAQVIHSGQYALSSDSLAVTNAVPPALSLIVADFGAGSVGPFLFVEGAQPSDLNCTFHSLADREDCIAFSNDDGVSFDYQPMPDANGIDPTITHLRFHLRGSMAPAAPEPSYFIIRYRMKVN